MEDFNEKEKMEDLKKKNNNKVIYIITSCFVLLVLLSGFAYWAVVSNKFEFLENLTGSSKNAVMLKHTSEVTVKTEGVYITDVSDVVDEVMPSIVAITSKTVINSGNYGPSFFGNGSYVATGAGSGVIVAEDDDEIFVLTNYHVIDGASELSVKFIDDKSYDASVKGVSERKDIAIVAIKKSIIDSDTLESIKIATIGDSNELKVGNGIIAIGNALGYGQSVTTGVVSALNREITTDSYTQKMIQIDAAINGGNSGGALINSKGEVVGINSAKYSSNGFGTSASIEGMGFAIPISDVEELIETLMNGEDDESNITLGIEGYMTSSGMSYSRNMPEGFYVSVIEDNSNAANSDLEIGNIITQIDNNKVTSVDVIKKVLNQKDTGDTVTLKVEYVSKNQYKEKEIKIKLK